MKERIYGEFQRKCAMSMYKNLSIGLGEMTFSKDFVNDRRGDLYPIIEKSEDCCEAVADNRYTVTSGTVRRHFCQFFPFGSYEAVAQGTFGFSFVLPDVQATLWWQDGQLTLDDGQTVALADTGEGLIVSCRPGFFDVYVRRNGLPTHTHTFACPSFADSNAYAAFSRGYVCLCAKGETVVERVSGYIDNGVSIADIRPVKYENGDVMMERGKVYFTASIRIQAGNYQGIFTWVPATSEFALVGVVFFDDGDGYWRGYIASTLVYHRAEECWLVWVSSFEHAHILARGKFYGDPRFGINVIDVTRMEPDENPTDIRTFAGWHRDEDPDLIYQEQEGRWLLAICRLDPDTHRYVYVFFESQDPLDGFTFVGKAFPGDETGGCFVRMDGELYFACGNDFNATSDYRLYSKQGMTQARFIFPDGGFRGWGGVMPLHLGSRHRCFWLTFDRHNGSDYNWSYGNLYVFELLEQRHED